MLHRLRRIATWTCCLGGLTAVFGSGGCGTGGAANAVADTAMQAQTAVNNTENAAVQIVQNTARQILNIPQLVYDLASHSVTSHGNTQWGRPKYIVVTDTSYVFIYDTPQSELARTHVPRMVIIARNDQTDPSRRI